MPWSRRPYFRKLALPVKSRALFLAFIHWRPAAKASNCLTGSTHGGKQIGNAPSRSPRRSCPYAARSRWGGSVVLFANVIILSPLGYFVVGYSVGRVYFPVHKADLIRFIGFFYKQMRQRKKPLFP